MHAAHQCYYGLCMDALVIVCTHNTNVTTVCAWMHWFSHDHIAEHERFYGLGMDALVTVCSWNKEVFLVWAWMHW